MGRKPNNMFDTGPSDDEEENADLLEDYRAEVNNILLNLKIIDALFDKYLENTSSFNDF